MSELSDWIDRNAQAVIEPRVYDPVGRKLVPVRIAIDFDGVLHSYSSGYTGPIPFDQPIEGSQQFCETLLHRGYELSIFSTRAHPLLEREDLKAFVEYLRKVPTGFAIGDPTSAVGYSWQKVENGPSVGSFAIRAWLKHHRFPEQMQHCEITHKKGHADLYVDDRGFRFDPRPSDEKPTGGGFRAILLWLERNPQAVPWGGEQ